MGQIYELQNGLYRYQLPDVPKDERDILGIEKKKKDQFWVPPDLSTYKRMPVSEKKDFVTQVRKWWSDGLWFMNYGEPVYITGLHFDFLTLQYFSSIETPDKRPNYWESHKEDFYFRDLTWKDNLCHGRLWFKPRRYGMTLQELAEMYYRATENFGRQVGVMSDEFKKTQDTLFRPMIDSMIHRPKYMRAEYYKPSNKVPKKELLLNTGQVPEENEWGDVEEGYLGGWVIPKPTTVGAFDAYKLHYWVADEVWKWTNASPKETWGSHKKVMEVAGKPIGKGSLLSTMGDSASYDLSVRDGVQMYHESDPEVRDANGKTKTGLYHYFVPGIYYMNVEMADKYGKIDAARAEEAIMNELANFTVGTKEYIYQKRRIPLTIQDALASATLSNIFDKDRIEKRLTILRKTPKDKLPYVEGTFEEENNGKVHWVPDVNGGPWKLHWLPLITKDEDRSNRWRKDYEGKIKLMGQVGGSIGYDPVRILGVDSRSGVLSKAAILVKQKYDYFGNGGANKFNAMYLHRPDDPNEPTYQCFLACKFFGYRAMIESNVERPREWFRDVKINATDLMEKGDDGFYGMNVHGRNNVVKDGIDMIQASILKPKPGTDDIDWLLEEPFEETLTEMNEFDKTKTTTFNLMMARIQLEFGLKKVKWSNVTDELMLEPPKGINAMVPGRKNSVMP